MKTVLPVVPALSLLLAPLASAQDFVKTCGTGLCLDGKPFVIHGASAFGSYDHPQTVISLAENEKLNTLEIVAFEISSDAQGDAVSEATWRRIDRFTAAAGMAGLHIILDLTSYVDYLRRQDIQPTAYDWGPFINTMANRHNTVTHVRYADDPTILMVQLYGEIPAPAYTSNGAGTTQQMNDFFKRTLAELKAADPRHLANTGGMSYLNDPSSGIDWRTIMNDPNDDVCAVEVNSTADRDVSVPEIARFCEQLGKPWLLAAWSACNGGPSQKPDFAGDLDHYSSDSAMAEHAQEIYRLSQGYLPESGANADFAASIGSVFWNLGPNAAPTCDINANFPQTLSVVQSNSPNSSD